MNAIDEIIKGKSSSENKKWRRKLEATIYEVDEKFKETDKDEWNTFELSQKILDNQIGIALQQRFDYLSGNDD